MADKKLFLCFLVIIVQSKGQHNPFDFSGILDNLFPNLNKGTGNSQTNYPSNSQNYPDNNGQLNNPGGNIWNNGNGNSGSNYPGQQYPGNGVQVNNRPPSRPANVNSWNPGASNYPNGQEVNNRPPSRPTNVNSWNPGSSTYPNGQEGNYPQTDTGSGWNRPSTGTGYPANYQRPSQYPSNNWNNNRNPNRKYPHGTHYPNGVQTGNVNYPQNNWNGDGENTNNNYPNQGYPSTKLQKLNPPNGGAGKTWNNGNLNSGVNYPGDAQTYPTNGYQGQGLQNPRLVPGNVRQGGNQERGINQDNYGGSQNAGYPQQSPDYYDQNKLPLGTATVKNATNSNPTNESSTPNSKSNTSQEQCIQGCSSKSNFEPVCGSNNVTYNNLATLQCIKKCGLDVTVSKEGACAGVKKEDS